MKKNEKEKKNNDYSDVDAVVAQILSETVDYNNLDWKAVSKLQEISEDFMNEQKGLGNLNELDIACKYKRLSNSFISEYKDKK